MEKMEKKARILVRLEQQLSERLRAHAKHETRSINSLISHALKTYMNWKDQ